MVSLEFQLEPKLVGSWGCTLKAGLGWMFRWLTHMLVDTAFCQQGAQLGLLTEMLIYGLSI